MMSFPFLYDPEFREALRIFISYIYLADECCIISRDNIEQMYYPVIIDPLSRLTQHSPGLL